MTANRFEVKSRKGLTDFWYHYEGTFVTRDGAIFVVPPPTVRRDPNLPPPGRSIENFMLRVLYDSNLDPRGTMAARSSTMHDAAVTRRNAAHLSQDLKGAYYRFARVSGAGQGTRSAPEGPGASSHRFDCLLLMGADVDAEATRRVRGVNFDAPREFFSTPSDHDGWRECVTVEQCCWSCGLVVYLYTHRRGRVSKTHAEPCLVRL